MISWFNKHVKLSSIVAMQIEEMGEGILARRGLILFLEGGHVVRLDAPTEGQNKRIMEIAGSIMAYMEGKQTGNE